MVEVPAIPLADYLGVALPALLRAGRPGAPPPDATIQVLIRDRPGLDVWYRFAGGELTVGHGVADAVDLTLGFVAGDLEAFSRRELDVPAAVRARRIRVHGDDQLLAWMATRLAP